MKQPVDNGPSSIKPIIPRWMVPGWPICPFKVQRIFNKHGHKFLIAAPSGCASELTYDSRVLRVG